MTYQLDGQVSMFDADMPFGRMSLEHSQAESKREQTSVKSSKASSTYAKKGIQYLSLQRENGRRTDASWTVIAEGGQLPGLCWMPVPGYLKDGNESTLSQILVEQVPHKYFLSERACRGILNRAEQHGRVLPDMLRQALEEVVNANDGLPN